MKKLLYILFLPLFLEAQDAPIGSWKDYLSYNSASYICEADDMIFCVANGGLFFVEKESNIINRVSKITGLSDVGAKQIAHSSNLNLSVIIYENCNIDVLENNSIINISDVKRKEIGKNKHFYYVKNPVNSIFSFNIQFGLGTMENASLSQSSQFISLIGTKNKTFNEYKNELQKIGSKIAMGGYFFFSVYICTRMEISQRIGALLWSKMAFVKKGQWKVKVLLRP